MLILDGTLDSEITALLERISHDSVTCTIKAYKEWIATHSTCTGHDEDHPDGIISLRVSPEIAHARIKKHNLTITPSFTPDYTHPAELAHLPILVLNGNIDFQTDFSHYYNHLFYIKRFIKQLQDQKDIALGTYKEKPPHRHCC